MHGLITLWKEIADLSQLPSKSPYNPVTSPQSWYYYSNPPKPSSKGKLGAGVDKNETTTQKQLFPKNLSPQKQQEMDKEKQAKD